ncbi:MAG: PAS domain-containing sensor histidine kinase [Ignavibacteria bacterium]
MDSKVQYSETVPKRFETLEAFKSLEEFPDTKSMVIADASGKIVYVNRSFENIFHLKEDHSFAEFESEPNLITLIEGLAGSKYASFHFDLFYSNIEKQVFTNYFVEIERIYVGKVEYFVFIFSSLADRQRLESEINTLHNALEYGNIPVIITNGEGLIRYSTKSFEQLLNTTIEFIYNKHFADTVQLLIDPAEIVVIKQKMKNLEKCVRVFSGANEDGSLWFKELKITPVKIADKESVNFIITANDITNYILNSRIIKRSEERQKSIINNISDLLLIVRSESGSLYFENANDNFYEVFSLKREKVLEKNIEDVFDKHFLMIFTQAIDSIIKTKSPSQEFRYKNYIIEREYLGLITYTDDSHEKSRIFIISLKDITEQILNEERLRKAYQKETHINKLKSSFLANMSHEIRTPLNAIVGYSELIEDDVKSGSVESAIELFPYLKEGFNRLLSFVDNILEVSLIQSGETEFDMSLHKVSYILESVYHKMMNMAVDKTMSFDIDIEDDELLVNTDIHKLDKIITVLVDNAIKYTDVNGSILLQTRFENNSIIINIKDTGRGIQQENLTRMFEPFTQEDEGHTRQYEGAGLGLTIAYNLTRMMGGELRVDTKPKQGTTMTLIFPGKVNQ